MVRLLQGGGATNEVEQQEEAGLLQGGGAINEAEQQEEVGLLMRQSNRKRWD